MDGVPAYAAVSEAVAEARRREGRGAAGLVNAVLRAVAATGEDPALFPDPADAPAEWLATWGSHPRWLVERWLGRWPADEVERLVEANNRVPPLCVVPLRLSPGAAVRRLAAEDVRARTVEGTDAVEVEGADPRTVLRAVDAVVQDPGSSLVVRYADAPAGLLVVDLCAAPGGKALSLAADGRPVLACDRSVRRLRLVVENAVRTGVTLWPVAALAERPPVVDAPVVLVDVPCTGTGTLRRHPDARWRLKPEDVRALATVQAGILRGAADVVSSGGLLVYSTCTLEPEENEEVVDAFLDERSDFRMERSDGAVDRNVVDTRGRLRVLPWRTGFDGAFAVRLRRQ
jgi:16S rRNA (cytosine967-C5)-methyltransferase